ncbi:hypothetical protein GCM10007415_33990 [Parapedobacter pyrenivorans]|uniref:DUF6965 domain-containing protein n=1 Tax=Parapedobacter pyrenivorans TaxID=1305674 RepID=A0A917HYM1_9SPHI|nr:hypothetical protein [Parapedobacter pyrenivorans]GGG95957.1 hypothetical protein GCM10007415_33990 [Parapedobacter pyrenivorans]
MTIQELEEFFAAHPVPPGTKQNAATTIVDAEKFLEVNLAVVKAWPKDIDKCPSYWHLCELAKVLSDRAESD